MGSPYSDYSDERRAKKKKNRARSRSGSKDSRDRSSRKKSKNKHKRSRSRSRGRRSRSRERYRSRSRDRRRSRSRSRGRYRRSRSKDSRRSRNRSRSTSRSRSESPEKHRSDRSVELVPGFSEMTPSEQNQVRMQLAIEKAQAADEAIRQRLGVDTPPPDTQARRKAISKIESDNFSQQQFKSNKKDNSKSFKTKSGDNFSFGTALDCDSVKTVEKEESVLHPIMFADSEERREKWHEKLKKIRTELMAQ